MDFARKALETAPDLTDTRINHIVHRIETGYYRIPSIIWNVVTKIIPALR